MEENHPVDSSEVENDDDHSEAASEEEEEECRVCRGPAEEGRPLYAPCKCSGSIGLVHQDCLSSWLAVTRSNGRCELCKTKFKFAPRYKEGAPDHLPHYEVVLGLANRVVEAWLPMVFRITTAALLWLGVVPLATAYLYHGWMHRPSSILTRFEWQLVPVDLVSGAVIASVIIVTFLSFMSFADFLRFNWNGEQGGFNGFQNGGAANANDRAPHRRAAQPPLAAEEARRGTDWDLAVVQLEIISRLQEYSYLLARDHESGRYFDVADERRREMQQLKECVLDMDKLIRPLLNEAPATQAGKQELERHKQTRELLTLIENLVASNEEMREDGRNDSSAKRSRSGILERIREQDAASEKNSVDEDNDELALEEAMAIDGDDMQQDEQPPPPLADAAADRADRLDRPQRRMNADDDADMDINVALDELLGLRGPLGILVRNVLWLLAFNTAFLGLFAFIPKSFGSSMNSLFLNRTAFSSWMYNTTALDADGELSFPRLISALNDESDRLNTTLRLPDVATITLGYLTLALLVALIQICVFLHSKIWKMPLNGQRTEMTARHGRGQRDHVGDQAPPAANVRAGFAGVGDEEGMDDMVGGLGEQLAVVLDCVKALTKVGFLLFHKMLLLPLVLGVWLDCATLDLFGSSRLERALYAGSDLFSSALLHWVAGITFMLFVTVSVLQLREVAHPGILAHIIRPQEPQPDLLSNLLHESLATHAKRMLLSFTIYAALLSLHVLIPARFLVGTGIRRFMPFARPKYSHMLMPQLQIPLELLFFHLTMLALLEKYKNRIGEMQHHWLVWMCDLWGITEYIIPRSVEKFELVGSRSIFLRNMNRRACHSDREDDSVGNSETRAEEERKRVDVGHVDPFWYDLIESKDDLENFLSSNLDPLDGPPSFEVGIERQNGERIPRSMHEVLVLPPNWTKHQHKETSLRLAESHEITFLPTTIGSYRLCRRLSDDKSMTVDFYKEMPGEVVPRPPAGWDDLGIGGAEVQGRWAWGNEKKSDVEHGIAARSRVFHRRKKLISSFCLVLKCIAVAILSWMIVSVIACLAFAFPIAVGRTVYRLLRVPDHYHHDPFAFAIGMLLWGPTFMLLSWLWKAPLLVRLGEWAFGFRFPPPRKGFVVLTALTLWLIVSPLALGIFYDLLFLKDRRFFSGEDASIDAASLLISWGTGTLLLNTWALLCFCSAFTWRFWVGVGNAALDVDVERHDNGGDQAHHDDADEDDNLEDNLPDSTWQGSRGKIGRFVVTLSFVVFDWEWDLVDREVLLDACAFPVARSIVTSLVFPSSVFLAWLFALSLANQEASNVVVPVYGEVENALYRAIVFRSFAVLALLAQFAATNQTALRRWFQAAHRAARDGRYLEGEILLNYVSEPDG